MCRLLAQDISLLDQIILLTQQSTFTDYGPSQLGFRDPMFFQLPLIHRDRGTPRKRAMRRPLKFNLGRQGFAVRHSVWLFMNNHEFSLPVTSGV
jgi:hypothetical protein